MPRMLASPYVALRPTMPAMRGRDTHGTARIGAECTGAQSCRDGIRRAARRATRDAFEIPWVVDGAKVGRAAPKRKFVPCLACPEQSRRPRSRRLTISAFSSGIRSAKTALPAVVSTSAVSMLSFSAIGIPCSGPAPITIGKLTLQFPCPRQGTLICHRDERIDPRIEAGRYARDTRGRDRPVTNHPIESTGRPGQCPNPLGRWSERKRPMAHKRRSRQAASKR